jgi:hypothetical protein
MASLFAPHWNLVARLAICIVMFALGALTVVLIAYGDTQYATGVGVPVSQPVPFSHEHHVAGLGLDCRYCHASAEESSSAGLPASQTCMNCHAQLYTLAPLLEPVRQSWQTDRPIVWNRVNKVPDFVFFDHSVHINAGVGCVSCHGRVDEMPLMWKDQTLYMQWCLRCHRDPEPSLREPEDVFRMVALEGIPARHLDRAWTHDGRHVFALHTASLTNCSACHR